MFYKNAILELINVLNIWQPKCFYQELEGPVSTNQFQFKSKNGESTIVLYLFRQVSEYFTHKKLFKNVSSGLNFKNNYFLWARLTYENSFQMTATLSVTTKAKLESVAIDGTCVCTDWAHFYNWLLILANKEYRVQLINEPQEIAPNYQPRNYLILWCRYG